LPSARKHSRRPQRPSGRGARPQRLDEGTIAFVAGLPCTVEYAVVTLDDIFGTQ
jgi:hypothetical protein